MSSTRDTLLNLGSLAGAVMIMVDASWFSFFLYISVALVMAVKNYEGQGKARPMYLAAEDIRKVVLDVDKSSEDEEPVEKISMVPEKFFSQDRGISVGDTTREGRADSLLLVPDEPPASEDVKELENADFSRHVAEDPVPKGESVLSKVQNLLRRSSSKSSTSSVDSDDEKEACPPQEEPIDVPREKASFATELNKETSASLHGSSDVSKPLNVDESNDIPEVPSITLNQENLPVNGDEASELASKPVDLKEADEFEAKPSIGQNVSGEISFNQGIDMHECISSRNVEFDADLPKRDDNPSGKEDGARACSNAGNLEQSLQVTENHQQK